MTTFVLIHGSWHDGAAWEPVIGHLEDNGHQAYGPTIAGHGKDVDKNVDHAQCTRSIVDFIESHDLNDIVLLGHSFGGTIISRVVQAVPERVKRLIFWNAFVLNDGESLFDNVPPHYQGLFEQFAKESADNTVMLPFPVWREAFMNDADLETATETYARLSPEPFQPIIDKLDMTQFYELIQSGKIACSYLNGTEDTALPPGEWGWHPRMSSRLGLHRLVQMPGGHEVIFTNPTGLAEKIIEAGRD